LKKFVTLEVDGARQRGRPRKTWKEVVGKDMNDLQLKPRDVMDRRKMGGGRLEGIGVIVKLLMLTLYVSGAGSPRSTRIKGH